MVDCAEPPALSVLCICCVGLKARAWRAGLLNALGALYLSTDSASRLPMCVVACKFLVS